MLLIFDLDGTLIDSDDALVQPFVSLGVPRESVTFGHVLGAECARLGIAVEDYLAAYDHDAAPAFAGADDLLLALAPVHRWAVCSNKHAHSGHRELARLGWTPELALFSDSFGGGPKAVAPVLHALDVRPQDAVFIGDTAHDRDAAAAAGVAFILAGWNPRAAAAAQPTDVVATHPIEVLDLLRPLDRPGTEARG